MAKKIDMKRIRKNLHLTQWEMARKLGVHQSTVARIELGREPSKPVLMLLEQLASLQ